MERVEVLPEAGVTDWSNRHDLQICQNMAHCNHCGANFVIPDGLNPVCESFRNGMPSAGVAVWALPPGQRLPTFQPDAPPDQYTLEPRIHECTYGRPGRYGQKHYSTDLVVDACAKCGLEFHDGDTAYVQEEEIIKVEGKTVTFTENPYLLCADCAKGEAE